MKTHTAIERILLHIEKHSLDLTGSYETWLKLAFALSSLGEAGRSYFHRLSRFHQDYDPAEADLQFSRCLASGGSGIGLGTLFHLAREAGVPLSGEHSKATDEGPDFEEVKDPQKLPHLPEEIFDTLPELLKKAVEPAESPEERDMLLLGSITCLSACLPTIYGIYDGLEVFSNLYLYITAAASSGKGKLNLCKRLVLPIHMKKRKEAEEMQVLYDSMTAEAGDKGQELPEKPKEKMLLLPANSSATGLFQLLADNEGRGLFFETEGDTLANIFKAEFGNYSDGYRKCFHHETISFYRRTDREYVDIQSPCLSTVLSGTPDQVHGLIPTAENGLFSRFVFYHLELDIAWKDTFRNKKKGELLDYYHQLGLNFMQFHELLCKQPPIQVVLTDLQQDQFYHFFSKLQGRQHALLDDVFVATVRRMGLIAFRLMMIFSALRYLGTEPLPHRINCREEDFNAALSMANVLIQHSIFTYKRLPDKKELPEKEILRLKFLRCLPQQFTPAEFLSTAAELRISQSTAYRNLKLYLKESLVLKKAHKLYEVNFTEELWGQQFSQN